MERSSLVSDLVSLGRLFNTVSNNSGHFDALPFTKDFTEKFYASFRLAEIKNPWFTQENIQNAFKAWSVQLNETDLKQWMVSNTPTIAPKTIAIVAAGNLPLVSFHDLLAVMVSGNKALIKLSSDDEVLMGMVVKAFYALNADYQNWISIAEGPLKNFDAVIATGSDNTARYFEHYFGKYPHIIRKNRTSMAVLTGNETKQELELLGKDIFTYFGMGCRNVSHLLVPSGYVFNEFFEAMLKYGHLINHNKYVNNYEYHRAIYLLEQLPFLDNNFLMIRENESLFSPLSTIHYSFYNNQDHITNYLLDHSEKLQCVVGKGYLPFGATQQPGLSDYADGVNTLEFLESLS